MHIYVELIYLANLRKQTNFVMERVEGIYII